MNSKNTYDTNRKHINEFLKDYRIVNGYQQISNDFKKSFKLINNRYHLDDFIQCNYYLIICTPKHDLEIYINTINEIVEITLKHIFTNHEEYVKHSLEWLFETPYDSKIIKIVKQMVLTLERC